MCQKLQCHKTIFTRRHIISFTLYHFNSFQYILLPDILSFYRNNKCENVWIHYSKNKYSLLPCYPVAVNNLAGLEKYFGIASIICILRSNNSQSNKSQTATKFPSIWWRWNIYEMYDEQTEQTEQTLMESRKIKEKNLKKKEDRIRHTYSN